ncbi:uncharacterized protein LOC131226100 [Magnolia sinica]|uniref:uncharacterized protein LOC131226100 n=1 Tax=Magnolia sinica TaxID=86752 RepID=UPI002658EDEC|nr:uncharacterized protein LOC131226100 [Magnolia sinica]
MPASFNSNGLILSFSKIQSGEASKMTKKPIQYAMIDAFTDTAFKGNPAAVCLLEEKERFDDDEWLQSVAREFNAPATAFLTRVGAAESEDRDSLSGGPSSRFQLRWFTPVAEIKPCGHGTLAASHFLFTSGLAGTDQIEYLTKAGLLTAKRVNGFRLLDSISRPSNHEVDKSFSIELNFPTIAVIECNSMEIPSIPRTLNGALVIDMMKTTHGYAIVVLSSGKAVADVQPQFDELRNCDGNGVIMTGLAEGGTGFDFITRFFCPKLGINEDHVCGMANCALAPYWSKKLGKRNLVAYMASPRGGRLDLHVEENKERVLIRGKAITIALGSLLV